MLYNAACNFALLGESDRALDGFERALAAGVAVGDWIKHDPDFESLRSSFTLSSDREVNCTFIIL